MNECDIFMTALDFDSPAERAAYLDKVCGDDRQLRQRIQKLLDAHTESGNLLEQPAAEQVSTQVFAELDGAIPSHSPDGPTVPTVEEFRLDFLAPSDHPGSIGRLGQYEIREVVGRGGMGIVLKGYDIKLSRVAAIKVLSPELASNPTAHKRFLREAKAAAAVSHDHIVTIYAVEEHPIPHLVMEFIDGKSLQQKIDEEGQLDLKETLRIARQIAAGLAAAHEQGLTHRDIKPSNILLQNGIQRVQITDFGLARAASDVDITRTGEIAGTPQFMSPEQAGCEPIDQRSDLFSLGSVIYAMCCGHSPFRAETPYATIKRVCEDAPSPIQEKNPDVPDWLEAIVLKLLAKFPADRFQTAAEVAELLSRHLAHVQDPRSTPFPGTLKATPSAPRPRRMPRHLIAAATVLIAVVGFSMAEATGVTHLASTVFRLVTGEGTLVIETDDPSVVVSLDGQELRISGQGFQELKLSPGNYQFQATKDGQPVKTELVSIERGGRQVVRITGESSFASPIVKVPAPETRAFVVLGSDGKTTGRFDTLADAVLGSSAGDTIEIRGNGPFVTPIVKVSFPLTIRAGDGFRPVIQAEHVTVFGADAPMIIEGLVLESTGGDEGVLVDTTAALQGVNCRFVPSGNTYSVWGYENSISLLNCELIASRRKLFTVGWMPKLTEPREERSLAIRNCIMHGIVQVLPPFSSVDFQNNSIVSISRPPLQVKLRDGKLADADDISVKMNFSGNVFDTTKILGVEISYDRQAPTVMEIEAVVPQLITWYENNNVFSATSGQMLELSTHNGSTWTDLKTERCHDLDDWNRFWALSKPGMTPGTVRFVGGDLRAKAKADPSQLAADDFRLRPDSAGYQAGPDEQDLGANIDFVGPGEAYERWKKTDDYQLWLSESRKMMQQADSDQAADTTSESTSSEN